MGWRCAILGAAFALHNIEEVLRFSAWQNIGMARPGVDQATFAVAVIMLTVTVAAFLAVAVRERMKGVWGWIVAIIAGGLLVNAAGHVVQSIVALAPVPGVYTGLLLVLPAAAWVLAGFDATPWRAWRKRFFALLLGAGAMPVLALTALRLAEVLMSWGGWSGKPDECCETERDGQTRKADPSPVAGVGDARDNRAALRIEDQRDRFDRPERGDTGDKCPAGPGPAGVGTQGKIRHAQAPECKQQRRQTPHRPRPPYSAIGPPLQLAPAFG